MALLDVNKRLLSGTGGVVVVSTMAAGQVGKVPGAPPEEEEKKKKSDARSRGRENYKHKTQSGGGTSTVKLRVLGNCSAPGGRVITWFTVEKLPVTPQGHTAHPPQPHYYSLFYAILRKARDQIT